MLIQGFLAYHARLPTHLTEYESTKLKTMNTFLIRNEPRSKLECRAYGLLHANKLHVTSDLDFHSSKVNRRV